MKVLSLFSGAGGLDIGVEASGAKIILSTDNDHDSIETLKINNKNKEKIILQEDINQLGSSEINNLCSLKKGELAFVVGGPPCQSFSKNNYWTKPGHEALNRRLKAKDKKKGNYLSNTKLSKERKRVDIDKNKNTYLIFEFARMIKELKPEGFLFENVASILHPNHKKYLNEFIEIIESLNYKVTLSKLSSHEYGVAQKRVRVFLTALKGHNPRKAEPTHSDEKSLYLKKTVGVKKVIAKFNKKSFFENEEIIEGKWAKYIKDIPPGMNYKALTEWAGYKNPIFEAETKFWNFLLKLHPDKPSWTIPASPGPWIGPFHWENRRLRIPELAAIQSFPENYDFYGVRRSIVRQIGNAAPPLLVKSVMDTLVEEVNGN